MSGNLIAPISLKWEGRLSRFDIYRTATASEKASFHTKGRDQDDISIKPNDPWDGAGVIPSSNKALYHGDELSSDQWPTLECWHTGLPCQLFLKPKQGVLLDVHDPDFGKEFSAPRRSQKYKNEIGEQFRSFYVYRLPKGTIIPDDIGIEQDGDNHVCLYPVGNNVPISNVDDGWVTFTIDPLRQLQDAWKPFAVFQVRANGFAFPTEFPRDTDLFPFQRWLTRVINCADSQLAMIASRDIEEYLSGNLTLVDYVTKMIDVSRRYRFDCDCDDIEMNLCVSIALKFFRRAWSIRDMPSATFMIKSTTLSDHRDGPRLEAKVIINGLSELETVSRVALGIDGGRLVVASSASVDLLFINAKIVALSPLPFKATVDGVEIVFEELEPCPVIECDASNAATSSGAATVAVDLVSEVIESRGIRDMCVEFMRSVPATPVRGTEVPMVDICVETSQTVAIRVECSRDEYDQMERSLVCCFGYTQTNERCQHRRKSLSGEKVWCYHHPWPAAGLSSLPYVW